MSAAKAWEWAKDGLSMAVIPLVLWVINLSVQNALRDERITQLQGEAATLREQQKQVDAVKEDLQKANLQMVRVEGKIDLVNGRLDEIKALVK
jgi:Tfp pilus assembly protein PilN